ncbi:MAG: hypothetical protein ABI718_13840 [Acidobacteriota bacterium]
MHRSVYSVKALHLNLAARPFRNAAPVYGTIVAAAVLCAVLTLYNMQIAWRFFVSTKETRAEIARVDAQTEKEQRATSTLEARVNRVNVKALKAETAFINEQIEARAFSWSRLLDDMESVQPKDVRLINLNPVVDKNGMTRLSISAVAKNHSSMIAFLRTLLSDSRFDGPFPQGETVNDDGTISFVLNTGYRPKQSELLR